MRAPSPCGAANSTNSKPLMPIGFSKVVTSMPRLGPCWVWVWVVMGEYSVIGPARCGAAGNWNEPMVIVSPVTICKAHCSMARPPADVRAADADVAEHEVLELERFLPYRLSVVS